MKLTGEYRNTLRKTCTSATLPNRNCIWIHLRSKPSLRSVRPMTNRQRHGTFFKA